MVFLTPPCHHKQLEEEFDQLSGLMRPEYRKVWIRWASTEESSNDLSSLIRKILMDEQESKIQPITEYLRHTLKAFVRHIIDGPAGFLSFNI